MAVQNGTSFSLFRDAQKHLAEDEFTWDVSPFGSIVHAMPRGPWAEVRPKFDPSRVDMVFLGHEFAPGFCHADYRVADVSRISKGDVNCHVHRTREIVVSKEVRFSGQGDDKGEQPTIWAGDKREVSEEVSGEELGRVLDDASILTDEQRASGWRVDRFNDRLVKVPPRSTRPANITPEDWRMLPAPVRKEIAGKEKRNEEGQDPQASSSADRGLVGKIDDRKVSFEGECSGAGQGRCMSLHEIDPRTISGRSDIQRVIVELCCTEESILGHRSIPGCLVVRVTEREDLTSHGTIQRIESIISECSLPVCLWVSTPCTSGCAWHRTNQQWLQGERYRKQLARHTRLAQVALELIKHAMMHQRFFAWEWPSGNGMWQSDVGRELRRMSGMYECGWDGCDFNLETSMGKMRKPWRLVTNSPCMWRRFVGRRCDRKHLHVQCRGQKALLSGEYNESIADAIHGAWSEQCHDQTRSRMKKGSTSDACLSEEEEKDVWNMNRREVIDELLDILKSMNLPKARQRTNVHENDDPIRGQLLGAFCTRGMGITGQTEQPRWRRPMQLIHRLASWREHGEDRPYCSMQITRLGDGQHMREHVDGNNEGLSDLFVLGDYAGGRHGQGGNLTDVHEQWVTFDGSIPHYVERVQGERYGIVLFRPERWRLLDSECKSRLQELGFPLEDEKACVCVHENDTHREHVSAPAGMLWAMVTRQIFQNEPEFKSEPCQRALQDELSRLREKGVWDETRPVEYQDLPSMTKGQDAVVGRVFAIMGEKHSEQSIDERTYKARVVFQGNNAQTVSGISPHELYKELSNSPASMAAARVAIGTCASYGGVPYVRDATQAYLQSYIDRPGCASTWVELPRAWWPESWFDEQGNPLYQRPLCKLIRALYGHPESGAIWEKHLGSVLRDMGWEAAEGISGVWTKPCNQKGQKACLVVYVDDLLLCAPKEFGEKFWRALERRVDFKDKESPLSRYLGANHQWEMKRGMMTMTVNMRGYIKSAVEKFSSDWGRPFRDVGSPYLADHLWSTDDDDTPGTLASSAASHVATLLFLARMARPDVLPAVVRLTRFVTKWRRIHDGALVRIFAYLRATEAEVMTYRVRVGSELKVIIWSDADLGGDPTDTKSTSGAWIEIVDSGEEFSWPVAWSSKRQGATSYSTCESEVVALAHALREEGIPTLDLIEDLLGKRGISVECREDNTQAIAAVKRGYSKKLRHLPRVHKLSVGELHEWLFGDKKIGTLIHHPTSTHKADIFTKPLGVQQFVQAGGGLGLTSDCCFGEGGEEVAGGKARERVGDGTSLISQAKCCIPSEQECLCMDRSCGTCGAYFAYAV